MGNAVVDVRKAFLYAPLSSQTGHRVVVRPPRVLVRTKIVAEAELRVIQRALYGLDIAQLLGVRTATQN